MHLMHQDDGDILLNALLLIYIVEGIKAYTVGCKAAAAERHAVAIKQLISLCFSCTIVQFSVFKDSFSKRCAFLWIHMAMQCCYIPFIPLVSSSSSPTSFLSSSIAVMPTCVYSTQLCTLLQFMASDQRGIRWQGYFFFSLQTAVMWPN